MRRALSALLAAALAGPAAGEGATGWVRLERDELGVVYGLRRVVKLAGPPSGFPPPKVEEWAAPRLSSDGSLAFAAPNGGGLFALWTGSAAFAWRLPALASAGPEYGDVSSLPKDGTLKPAIGSVGLGMAQVGDVLLVGVDSNLVGLEAFSGKPLWSAPVGGVVGGLVTVTASVAIVPIRPNGYVAINALTGEIKWRLKRPKTDGITERGQAPAEVDRAARRVYVGTSAGEVLALSLDSGEVLWTARLGTPKPDVPFPDVDTRPVLVDGGRTLIAASYNGGLAALDAKTGAIRWQRPEVEHLTGLTRVDGSAYLVASVGDGLVLGVDPADGAVRWRYGLRGGVPTPPTALEHGLVAVGSSKGSIAILDGATGKPRQLTTPGSGLSAPLDRAGKELVAFTNKGHLLFFRLGEGTSITAR